MGNQVEEAAVRSKLAKAVRKRFDARLSERLPQFQAEKSPEIPPGDRLYAWQLAPGLSAYLLLVLFPSDDWFTLEAAWSRHQRFPVMAPPSLPHEEAKQGELRFRAHTLWADARADFWWKLGQSEISEAMELLEQPPEELLPRVETCVEAAVQDLVQHVVPYFRQLLAKQGSGFNP